MELAARPVYLQLLEGLRRVTEGQRGAGLCRECGQPFLTLDAPLELLHRPRAGTVLIA